MQTTHKGSTPLFNLDTIPVSILIYIAISVISAVRTGRMPWGAHPLLVRGKRLNPIRSLTQDSETLLYPRGPGAAGLCVMSALELEPAIFIATIAFAAVTQPRPLNKLPVALPSVLVRLNFVLTLRAITGLTFWVGNRRVRRGIDLEAAGRWTGYTASEPWHVRRKQLATAGTTNRANGSRKPAQAEAKKEQRC